MFYIKRKERDFNRKKVWYKSKDKQTIDPGTIIWKIYIFIPLFL